tara:strand:- start:5386 stop:6486 length:1101 start_codon:yes stop_codon:yes gene_type:complete
MKLGNLTLKGLRARAVVTKLNRPIVNRLVTIEDWPLILIDLYTEEGVTGHSYLQPYAKKAMRYLIPALNDMADLLQGRSIAPFEFFDTARTSLRYVGYSGQSLVAVSGLDMAAWDALAKAAEVPLCVLLGGTLGPVKAYNSNGLWLKTPSEVGDEAVELVNEGAFNALKLRLGRKSAAEDIDAIESARGSVGGSVELMIDFSQALDMSEALRRCHAIDDLGLSWIEDPINYENLDGCAVLTENLKTPIQIGEHFYGPKDLHNAIQKRACNFVMPDFMRIGGVTGWLRSSPIAAAAGIPMSTHLYPEVAAHLMRVTETAHWLEWQDWAESILQSPYVVRNGYLQIPDAPGLGLQWNEDFVNAHLIDL